ncbi:monosaccharide ABC transporter ATP-binding protein, CUT2 family [Rhizobiales bacterium GAS191]|nr:monosaccharide ABC transporter ATP-binding protein, CUT2 family [Rhizobiales bacterium GAS113]SEC46245.1 monosaccharide ABC transporter ATP-binding protein, CUT2 family [Rhizobiales bacterium GAS188]SEC81458.1 monosaccharide ABC transporter ATP-binding protein, CUT2 family [Rhizobiales bacterium GAS191]
MPPSSPLLVMRSIDKRFSGAQALAAATLEVKPAEVMALVGENGAGKSTLIKVLTGAHRKDAGSIEFAGQGIEFASPQEAQRGGISTIYQEINLIPYRTVAENIFLGREFRRYGLLDWRRMNGEAAELLHRFAIDIDVRRSLMEFSTAIQQMVAIARAISFKSRLVIMDEPTSSLDGREVAVLFDVIRQLRAEGVAVIFISHRLDELYQICDRVTVMRDGCTVMTSAMADVDKLQLIAAMLGRNLDAVRERSTGFQRTFGAAGGEVLAAEGLEIGRRVRGARVEVRTGQIVGLAGLLGSGRTEVARAIFGADPPDSGTIRLMGKAVSPQQPAEAIALGVGFCTEDRKVEGIIPEMSVRENITLSVLPRLTRAGIVDETREREIVDRFMARLAIKASSVEQKVRELSGGNQQKVMLARWLCIDPKLLILDEPTRGIDVGAKAEIQSLIRELADQGLGVLMISSELEEIVEGADRVFVLSDGCTVADLPHAEVDGPRIMAAMAHGMDAALGPDRDHG